MKYLIVLADGMSDYPVPQLNGKTPMEAANKPMMDFLAAHGECMNVVTVSDTQSPGSDVANLSVLGYNADKFYTGRSPLEAAGMGISLSDNQVSFRANLVCIKDGCMHDYSAGEITTQESAILIEALAKQLSTEDISFFSGVSYRHLMVWSNWSGDLSFTPPHDISDKPIADYLPKNPVVLDIMLKSQEILRDHEVNRSRVERGLSPANSLWIWGCGKKPSLPLFSELYGVKGAVISAVDLVNGIGFLAGMKIVRVEGATGNIDTNFKGKAQAAFEALESSVDLVYLHVEAPDECGHRGECANKIKSIELIDQEILSYIKPKLDKLGKDYKIMVLCDHATPIVLKTHVKDPVPCLIYNSTANKEPHISSFTEKNVQALGRTISPGYGIMKELLEANK